MSFFDYTNPQSAANLGLISGLLAASGPHRLPVTLGQAFGVGMQNAQQSYNNALKAGLTQQQINQLALTNAFTKARLGWMSNALGQTPNTPSVAPGSTVASQGIPQGNGVTSYPYGSNPAPSLTTGIPNQAAANGYSQAPQNPQIPRPSRNTVGQASPSIYGKTPYQLFQQGYMGWIMGIPGSANLMNMAAEYDPNLQGHLATVKGLAAKGMYMDPTTGQVKNLPGYGQSQGQQQAEIARATLPEKAAESYLRYAGRPVELGPGETAVSGFSMLPPSAQSVINRGLGGSTPVGPPAQSTKGNPAQGGVVAGPGGMPVAYGIRPDVVETQRERATQSEKWGNSLQESADNAVQTNYSLDQMTQATNGFTPGPGTNFKMQVKSGFAAVANVLGAKPPTMQDLTSWQEFTKYANKVAFAATRQMGAREAAQIVDLQIKSNPNADLTPQAVKGLIASMHGMNDYIISKNHAAGAWRQSHNGTLEGFNEDWTSKVDPRAWDIDNLNTQQQQAFINSLSKSAAAKFRYSYQLAHE